ncbi:Serine protease family s09x [Globisporangium polare]
MENAEVAQLRQLSQRVCASVTAYVGAQLSGSLESMELLQQVVLNVERKHTKMRKELQSVGKLSKHLKAKADAIDDKLKTIDAIDEELTELEDMVEQLEQYTGSLETKFYEVS